MKLGPVELPALVVPRLGLAAFRRRAVVHLAFLLLALATVGLVLTVLIDQKQRAYQRYAQGFRQSLAEIVLQLRHPSGQLALLNPTMGAGDRDGQAPVLLPFSAIDFDDQNKAQRAVEMAGCGLRWPDGASLCAAVGANAYAGGFLYLVGSLESGPLAGREHGALDLSGVHRARVTLKLRGSTQTWIAPFEGAAAADGTQRGRLTGFLGTGPQLPGKARPMREFRGWLWREGPCAEGSSGPDCARRTFYSIRLPVEAFQDALFDDVGRRARPVWPPADLDQMRVRVELLGPSEPTGPANPSAELSAAASDAMPAGTSPTPAVVPVLFDSAKPGASLALSLDRIGASLQPGETLRIERLGKQATTIAERRGPELSERALPWLIHVMRRLPVQGEILGVGADTDAAEIRWLTASDEVATPSGRYRLDLRGDLRSLDRQLALEARPLAWLAAAMLAAVALAWLMVELGLIRGIAVLTKRAAAVSYNMQDARAEQRIGELDVADLRGRDELGILAGSLADALTRVKDGLRREQLRAEREREMWHAVGHEIMSPLQSLMVLHGGADDPSHRYVQRMQQAVKVLYGSAPPSEALASADLHTEVLDLAAFCREVAENAHYAGIAHVNFETALPEPQPVHAEAYALEDAVTHVLRNADRYRPEGTPIAVTLEAGEPGFVLLRIRNQGPQIEVAMLDQIFEYGVSDTAPQVNGERRGQGLFVAKTYLAKMDGSIRAFNVPEGVVFEMSLRRAAV